MKYRGTRAIIDYFLVQKQLNDALKEIETLPRGKTKNKYLESLLTNYLGIDLPDNINEFSLRELLYREWPLSRRKKLTRGGELISIESETTIVEYLEEDRLCEARETAKILDKLTEEDEE